LYIGSMLEAIRSCEVKIARMQMELNDKIGRLNVNAITVDN